METSSPRWAWTIATLDSMESVCHHCGEPLGDDSVGGGLCPVCLWQILPGEVETVPVSGEDLPKVDGHEIIEELARGGMGIVYRARQLDPRREVALKMLLPMDRRRTDLRERFRVEIRALAELDHPAILPLYQVGESEGRPWFSMKLAAGGSLATLLRRGHGPFAPERAGALMADLAEAVQYAHAHGVLHRDIKPGNILFDERGTAFLADFGLAKLVDAGHEMTHSGAVMGTPCYMAPEVASQGARAGTVSSDVYGLGAVLYELLSGRPPFIVEGMAALVRKIVEDEPERPSTLVDHVPRDLELVCLTCLAKEPRKRYASAGAVAEDLRRWLRGEPVAARRAGVPARVWAWARRRPALAGLSVTLGLTLAGSTVWLASAYASLNTALTEARESRDRADAQSEFLIGEFADSLEKMGRLDLIEAACIQASRMEAPMDNAGKKRSARLRLRWAEVKWAGGFSGEAADQLLHAQRVADSVVRDDPTDAEALALALNARSRRAEVVADSTSFDEADRLLDEAESILKRPQSLTLDEELRQQAEIDRIRAVIITKLRSDTDALEPAARATASFRAWQARDPKDEDRTLALVTALRQQGIAVMNLALTNDDDRPLKDRQLDQALSFFREARTLAEGLCAQIPPPAAAEFELAQSAGWMGAVLGPQGQSHLPEALACLELDHEIMTRLVNRDPLNWRWQFKLSDADFALGRYYQMTVRPELAEEHNRRRQDRLAVIARQGPKVREWMLAAVSANAKAGVDALARGERDKTRSLLSDTAAEALRLVRRQPASRTEQDGWRNVTWQIAAAWQKAGDPAEASAVYLNAIAAARTEAESSAAAPWWRWTAAAMHRRLADLKRDQGDLAGALEANLAALAERAALLRSHALRAVEDPGGIANSFRHSEMMQLKMNLHAEALQTAEAALDLFVECRDVAGSPEEWASPLKSVVEECLKAGPPHDGAARTLAGRAVAGFFPPEALPAMNKEAQDLAQALRTLAGESKPPTQPPQS